MNHSAGNPAPPPALPAPGTLLGGRYQVEGVLGLGSSGLVLAARDGDQPCAVKLYHHAGTALLHRFHRERDALLRLRHPCVVVARESGWHEGLPFLVMERVEGSPLRTVSGPSPRWAGGPVDPSLVEVVQPLLRLLDVLESLHTQGWVHRDLSPANVLVEADGRVRVLDLGLAAPAGERQRQGTWGWMAPEQALGRETGPATDLYAVGALLYHVLTGTPPWAGLRGAELLHRQLTGRLPPPEARNPGIPPALGRLVMALLAADPGRRPAPASAARSLLRAALEGEDPTHPCFSEPGWGLVGREHEEELVRQRLEALREDRTPAPVLWLGEAGLGKTALLEHAVAQCLVHQVPPLRLSPGAVLRCQAHNTLSAWHPDGEAPPLASEAQAVERVWQGLLDRAPCALFIDNLDHEQPLGLALLRRAPPPGVWIAATSCQDPPEGLHPGVTVRLLAPLRQEDLQGLVDGDAGLAALLADASDGHPLLAQETLRAWRNGGRVRPTAAGWELDPALTGEVRRDATRLLPDRFAAALRQRAAAHGPAAARVLDALAALDGQATWKMLLGCGVASEDEAREALQALVRDGLLTEPDGDPPRYLLIHALAAEVLAQDLRPATVRRQVSRALDADPDLPRPWRVKLLRRAGRIYEAARFDLADAEELESHGALQAAGALYAEAVGCLAGE